MTLTPKRIRSLVYLALFVASAGWVSWLVITAIIPDQRGCGASFVHDPNCWSSLRRVLLTAAVGALALVFGVLVARTFRLAVAEPSTVRDQRRFGIARVAAVVLGLSFAGALLLAAGEAFLQGRSPVSAATSRCHGDDSTDGVNPGPCVLREMARSGSDVFFGRMPVAGAIAALWMGSVLVAESARVYRRPFSRAHSSK